MSQPRVPRQSTDIVLKLIAAALGGDLFARFGVPLPPIFEALPTELPRLEVRTQRTDQLFPPGRRLHPSFGVPDHAAPRRAHALLRLQPGRLPAVSAARVDRRALWGRHPQRPDTWQYGSQNVRVQNILVGQEDGVAVLQRLHEKAARGEPFTATDRVDLIFSPLMRQSRPVQDVLREAAPLTQHLPAAQQEPTVGALLGLAYHYVEEDVVRAILEELSMANPLQELIDERVAQGEARGKREALRMVLLGRFGLRGWSRRGPRRSGALNRWSRKMRRCGHCSSAYEGTIVASSGLGRTATAVTTRSR
jgi:hypothetical protein